MCCFGYGSELVPPGWAFRQIPQQSIFQVYYLPGQLHFLGPNEDVWH